MTGASLLLWAPEYLGISAVTFSWGDFNGQFQPICQSLLRVAESEQGPAEAAAAGAEQERLQGLRGNGRSPLPPGSNPSGALESLTRDWCAPNWAWNHHWGTDGHGIITGAVDALV